MKTTQKQKNNWQTKKLGEVCGFEGGSQPPKSNFIYEPRKGYVRFLQIRDFRSDKNITYIPDSKKNRYCSKDDILLGRYGASVGKILVNKKGAYNVAVMKTIPNLSDLNKQFFYYYLISNEFQDRLSKVSSRSAQAGFSKDDIYNFPVIIPPLLEQKRIVKILDEAFEKIEKAKENTEKNLKNSKELFESCLQGVFENKDDDWVDKILGEVLITPPKNGWSPPAKFHSGSGIPVLTLSAVTGFVFKKESVKYTSIPVKKDAYYWLNEGDLLITRSNTPELVGHVAICEDLDDRTIYPDLIMKINPKNNIVNTRFLYYQLKSPKLRKIITSTAHGANPTMKKINKQDVQNFKISYPSLSKQKQIVTKLDKLSAQTKKLEENYKKQLEDLEELKKSLLKKAFNGEL